LNLFLSWWPFWAGIENSPFFITSNDFSPLLNFIPERFSSQNSVLGKKTQYWLKKKGNSIKNICRQYNI